MALQVSFRTERQERLERYRGELLENRELRRWARLLAVGRTQQRAAERARDPDGVRRVLQLQRAAAVRTVQREGPGGDGAIRPRDELRDAQALESHGLAHVKAVERGPVAVVERRETPVRSGEIREAEDAPGRSDERQLALGGGIGGVTDLADREAAVTAEVECLPG